MKMDESDRELRSRLAADAPARGVPPARHDHAPAARHLTQLGVIPKLQIAADSLPDARSRLNYIASKTSDAANKVLNSVDRAKVDHAHQQRRDAPRSPRPSSDPVTAVASGAVMNFVGDVEGRHRAHRPAPHRHHAGAGLPRSHRPGGGQGRLAGHRAGRQLVKLLVQVVPPPSERRRSRPPC